MSTLTKKAITGLCEACGLLKKVKMYVLQNGQTAWVCKSCRGGDDT